MRSSPTPIPSRRRLDVGISWPHRAAPGVNVLCSSSERSAAAVRRADRRGCLLDDGVAATLHCFHVEAFFRLLSDPSLWPLPLHAALRCDHAIDYLTGVPLLCLRSVDDGDAPMWITLKAAVTVVDAEEREAVAQCVARRCCRNRFVRYGVRTEMGGSPALVDAVRRNRMCS